MSATSPKKNNNETFEQGTFGFDLQFLQERDAALVVLRDDSGNAQVILSAKYQGKVLTSTAQGLSGKSFGWVNYKAFAQLAPGVHMNALGGEDRLWIGPEGGQFSVFFQDRAGGMDFANWYTPEAFDCEPWTLAAATKANAASFWKDMRLVNYSGTAFKLKAERHVSLLAPAEIEELLGIKLAGVHSVAFSTHNSITNTGDKTWDETSGAVCIWMLDMLTCGKGVTIVVPYKSGSEKELGKVATTDYFGEIPPGWLRVTDGAVLLKADGKQRAKIGLSAQRALPVAGSYDAEHKVLTVVRYSVHPDAKYVNQQWPRQAQPFVGDAVNAYNDGPLADGSQMGPFYEIESSSPAALLAPGASLAHEHAVFHFAGEEGALNRIAEQVLHVGIAEIKAAF